MFKVKIEFDTCEACGECVAACPNNLIKIENNAAVAEVTDMCEGCASCAAACPNGNITVEENR